MLNRYKLVDININHSKTIILFKFCHQINAKCLIQFKWTTIQSLKHFQTISWLSQECMDQYQAHFYLFECIFQSWNSKLFPKFQKTCFPSSVFNIHVEMVNELVNRLKFVIYTSDLIISSLMGNIHWQSACLWPLCWFQTNLPLAWWY